MIHLKTEYLNINRILLLTIGMWPYQRSKLVQFQIIVYYSLFLSLILVQLTAFLTTKNTTNFTTKVLSETLLFSLYVTMYNAFCVNNQTIKYLLDQLQYVFNELQDDNEIAIIESYGCKAKRSTAMLTLLGMSLLGILIIQPLLPHALNAFLYVNISKRHSMYITTEYFVDEEKYFYLIKLHTDGVICLGSFVLLATGTMMIAYLKCICGMFRIASYRIDKALKINITKTDVKDDLMVYNGIIHAVDIHRKAIMSIKFFISNFEGSFFFAIMCWVICLSLNLYHIFRFVSFGGKVEELITHSLISCDILLYIFISNYCVQEVLDHDNQLFISIYNSKWYNAPLYIQRMILFLLQRGTKAFSIKIGGLFVASMEGTTMLISTSMSYFTVLCSIQY